MFIEAFHDACESLQRAHPDYVITDAAMINRILAKCEAGYQESGTEPI